MINIKTNEEIKIIRQGGKILAKILKEIAKNAQAGVSTLDLNNLAEKLIQDAGGIPSFKNYAGYPAALCAAVNNEVVHGIPSENKILKEGDIVGLDLGLKYKNYFTDMAITVGVGRISAEAKRLMQVTRKALEMGIKSVKQDNFTGDIGFAVQEYVESRGFSVVRDLVGHGVGYGVHEEPMVPNFGAPKSGVRLKSGMVIAIEPMINAGDWRIKTLSDGWTVVTADGSLSAHFEHTVVVTEKGREILTKE